MNVIEAGRLKLRAALRFAVVVAALAVPVLAGCGGAKNAGTTANDAEWRQRSHERIAVDGADTSRITLSYPEFTLAPAGAERWVREATLRSFEGDTAARDTNAVMAGFLNAWLEERRGSVPGSLGWMLDRKIEVVGDTLGVISMRQTEFVFTGGAHPNTMITQASFDATNGALLEFGDVFHVAARDSLSAVADPLWRRPLGIAPDADLSGFEFPNGRFRLNDNFSIGPGGVTFIFNAYEIAPYALGSSQVVIPWETARPFLRADAPPGRNLGR